MPASRKILITAGPTREMLDPVRFLSNLSTGEMGYQTARMARRKGHKVILVSGPTALKPPHGVKFVSVVSAAEMKRACEKYFPQCDAIIMTAAVCDFTAAKKQPQKIHRTETQEFRLKQTPDIIAGLASRKGKRVVIGFCLETENWLQSAKSKLKRKKMDGIVANYYTARHVPFGDRRINTAFIGVEGKVQKLKNKSKKQVAESLLFWLEARLNQKPGFTSKK